MPLDIGLWRLDDGIQRLLPTVMPGEKRLEDLIETDPSVLGQPLLLIGRQVPTSYGKYVDLLALDGDGAIHVLELKRDRTPRDVVAQILDYGSWVQNLSHEDVLGIYAKYAPDNALEVAFDELFGVPVPEELNTGHFLTVVAGDLDPASSTISLECTESPSTLCSSATSATGIVSTWQGPGCVTSSRKQATGLTRRNSGTARTGTSTSENHLSATGKMPAIMDSSLPAVGTGTATRFPQCVRAPASGCTSPRSATWASARSLEHRSASPSPNSHRSQT